MAWKKFDPKIRCSSCDGDGEEICECCGSTTECENCGGEGIEPDAVDLNAFHAACVLAFSCGGDHDGSWALIENNVWVGRQNKTAKVYYRDFLTVKSEEK